jgi:hypothetical protein
MFPELKNHQVWQDLTKILHSLDANTLVREHLELCNYKVCGYWDEQDEYHEEVLLPHNIEGELISNSIGVTENQRWIQLKFALNALNVDKVTEKIGELILIYDENLEFINESWLLDIDEIYKFTR